MPGSLLPSGEVNFVPQEHTLCGICRNSFMLCGCVGFRPQSNYILTGLPPPLASSSTRPQQLIKRWTSLVIRSASSIGAFDGTRWYDENHTDLVAAMAARAPLLTELIDDFVAALPTDSLLPSYAQILSIGGAPSLKTASTAVQAQRVGAEARAAMQIFLAGDWACLTRIGITLVQNAFQVSNPQKYRLNDAQLALVFRNGIGLVHALMDKAFDGSGWLLAMEMDRRPCGTRLESAAQRLMSNNC